MASRNEQAKRNDGQNGVSHQVVEGFGHDPGKTLRQKSVKQRIAGPVSYRRTEKLREIAATFVP